MLLIFKGKTNNLLNGNLHYIVVKLDAAASLAN